MLDTSPMLLQPQQSSKWYLNMNTLIGLFGIILIGAGIYKLVEASKMNPETQAKEKKNAQIIGGLLIGLGCVPFIGFGYKQYKSKQHAMGGLLIGRKQVGDIQL